MANRTKCILIILISIFVISGCNSTAKTTSEIKMEEAINSFCKDKYFSGSILVTNNGKTILNKGYGFADYEDKILNTSDTIFRLASITKQFTAMSIMILEERGDLKVNDPINRYIKEYPNGAKITIHNLLTHTSGIAEYTNEELFQNTERYYSPTDLINLFKDKPLNFTPGERFEYCNSNYVLLGYIIEKVSNMKYEDFVKENVFIPLGMEDTGYDHNEEFPKKAIGYNDTPDSTYVESDYIDMSIPYAAGALQSTTEDLSKWHEALCTYNLLTKESMSKMFTPYLNSYGYGWVIIESGERPVMEHEGRIHGFATHIYRNVELNQTVIILSNNSNTDTAEIKSEILSILRNE